MTKGFVGRACHDRGLLMTCCRFGTTRVRGARGERARGMVGSGSLRRDGGGRREHGAVGPTTHTRLFGWDGGPGLRMNPTYVPGRHEPMADGTRTFRPMADVKRPLWGTALPGVFFF